MFRRIVAEKRVERVPAIEVIKRQPKQVFLSMFARTAEQAPAYIYLAFVFTYGTQVLHQVTRLPADRADLRRACSRCSPSRSRARCPTAIGRKRIYIIGTVLTGLFGFVYFALLNTMVPGLIFLGIVLSFVPHDLMYGPQAALIAEGFTPRLRYSGCSIGYQLASVTAGGPAPLIATALFAALRIGLRDRGIYRGLRHRQHHRHADDARPHQ